MPGYKSLSYHVTGDVADDVRRAEVLLRSGERKEAVHVLEHTLEDFARTGNALPGWLCGRLAVLYRSLGRHEDEVRLLERYRDSQSSDEARTRYDARLSKAQAIAERAHRNETIALSSVGHVIRGSQTRTRRDIPTVPPAVGSLSGETDVPIRRWSEVSAANALSPATILAVRQALASASRGGRASPSLDGALRKLTKEARARGLPAEQTVVALKEIWASADRPIGISVQDWYDSYDSSLMTMLGLFFEEGP